MQLGDVLNQLCDDFGSIIAVAACEIVSLCLIAHQQRVSAVADDAVPILRISKVLHLEETDRGLCSWAELVCYSAFGLFHITKLDEHLLNIRD